MILAELEQTMAALAGQRPIFHSEADFQHAFAWQLQRLYPQARIRLETRPRPGVRLDVLAYVDGRRVAVELKYLLRKLSTTIEDELFELPFQGAQDTRRYDFIKDVARLEALLRDEHADYGYAVALTNDPLYWRGGDREDVADAAFRLGEGRTLAGVMDWSAQTGAGTKLTRDQPLSLAGSYELQWRDFSQVEGGHYGTFRYLVVAVS